MEHSFEAYQKNIERLNQYEKYRKEQHDSSRIIFYREMPPLKMYENVVNNTVFTYKNRVLEEGKKVIFRLKGIRRKKIIGSSIQWIGVLFIALLFLYGSRYQSIEWDNDIKLAIFFAMFIGAPLLLIIGGGIRSSGRTLMAEYIQVMSPFRAPMEFNCLANGQLVLMRYIRRDKSSGHYESALNPDDTIWRPMGFDFKKVWFPTYISYMYVIDSVKSCTRTENGLMLESSGRYYGIRVANRQHHSNGSGKDTNVLYYVFAETQVSYRKEEIPAIFTDMDKLESSLMSYGYFEPGRNTFSPLQEELN